MNAAVLASALSTLALLTPNALADSFTMTSPAGGTLPPAFTIVGGIVTDLVGLNGTRIVAEVPSTTEFIGNAPSTNVSPQILLFGSQYGFSPFNVSSLGGGLQAASFRVSLYHGDDQAGQFNYNLDTLLVGSSGTAPVGTATSSSNGVNLGNFSSVTTQQTSPTGTALGPLTSGFGLFSLNTGFFTATDTSTLDALYNALLTASQSGGNLNFQISDLEPSNQYFDFTQGPSASVFSLSDGPPSSGTSPVPEPSTLAFLGTGLLGGIVRLRRLRRS